ncbi:P-loop containing nucleoside triphosphate hydrolase protein, partial [Piptocephalis cylindrospora]
WPPFAFYRSLSILNMASTTTTRLAYRLSDLRGGDQVMAAMLFLAVETIIFLALAYYLGQVVPGEYGVQRPWYFPFKALVDRFSRKKIRPEDLEGSTRNVTDFNVGAMASEEELQFEDDDVREERQRILSGNYPHDAPLVLKNMRKVYPNGKLSVKDVTLATEKSQIFGLLGPNGAGKTSLISMLTGLYPSTGGEARVSGYDLRTQLSSIFLTMGVCPQHDILWGDLTVEEHLYFYARLKGIPVREERAQVDRAISRVSLTKFARRLSRGLSGGEKRRLSIAISLMGDPGVVFLDEPTTGLDPEVKRIIWDIVQDARQGRTIILTTHSMEEAEVLCQRIAIMAKGTLRCIGSQLRLKQVYGNGFRLTVSATKPSELGRAMGFIESILPPGRHQRLDTFVSTVSYEFQLPSETPSSGSNEGEYTLSRLFERLEQEGKEINGVEDWGLSQVSLEEVFLKIIREDDADAE